MKNIIEMKPTSEMKGFNMVRVLLRASHGYMPAVIIKME